jgi:energy-coupling factor transporter ATP-binding protein EcfA2
MSLEAVMRTFYPEQEPVNVETTAGARCSKSTIGLDEKGRPVSVSKKVKHRAIVGITGAGKTTLAQSLKEVDLHRKRKVVELEPALEAKCEGIFMNLPNDDHVMVKILEKDFGLEPEGFRTIAYTPNTAKYRDFIEKYPEMKKFFKPLRITEEQMINMLLEILPGGPVERMLLQSYMQEIVGEYDLDALVYYIQEREEVPAYMKVTATKIRYISNIGVISDEGVPIEKILDGKEASILTLAFVNDPLDRFMVSLIYLTAIYETWKEMQHKRVLSFFVADSNLFAPAQKKDMLDSLVRYQLRARAQLQIYSRISRGQGVAWTLDFQTWNDLDDAVRSQMHEFFFKRGRSSEVAKMLNIEPNYLKRLGTPYAYFDNMRSIRKIKIRPPLSRKAKEGQFTPHDFVNEYRRFEDEEATHDI